MTTRNGTIVGVSLVSGDPAGVTNTVSSVVYTRKAYLIAANFTAWTTGDAATITGINTAIAAATRNGASLTLIAVVPCSPGQSADAPPLTPSFTDTANAAVTITNSTTTGDAGTAILADSSGTDITTVVGPVVGVQVIAIVDEH
jgi:hypothetical protein